VLVQRPPLQRRILELGRARVGGPDQDEDPGPRLRRRLDERLHRVVAEQRVDGEGVGPEATGEPLRIDGRGKRHVPPLAVGDHQQAGIVRVRDHLLQRCPSGRPEPLEAGELRLNGDAGRTGLLDQLSAMRGDGLGGGIRRIESEANLALALRDERRQSVREWLCAQTA
jgi:hypothetical protein